MLAYLMIKDMSFQCSLMTHEILQPPLIMSTTSCTFFTSSTHQLFSRVVETTNPTYSNAMGTPGRIQPQVQSHQTIMESLLLIHKVKFALKLFLLKKISTFSPQLAWLSQSLGHTLYVSDRLTYSTLLSKIELSMSNFDLISLHHLWYIMSHTLLANGLKQMAKWPSSVTSTNCQNFIICQSKRVFLGCMTIYNAMFSIACWSA